MATGQPGSSREANRRSAQRHLPKPDGFRDTIESIVIAFIFAFVFRAFVVEAFVIPTGSMAPTLHGLHGRHRCAVCEYPFAYGIRVSTGAGTHNGTLAKKFKVACPNCGWDRKGNDEVNRPGDRVIPSSGDRILVLKWPYDLGGSILGPKRWDVVVFKDPQDGDQNFIKRLLGLPGEVLEIIDGDIYAAPVEALSPDLLEALARPRPEHRRDAPTLPARLRSELDRHLVIQRKTRIAQESLWLNHYDHDYLPRTPTPTFPAFDPPRWVPRAEDNGRSPWDAATSVITFKPNDDREYTLVLDGRKIVDRYGYNLPMTRQKGSRSVAVGDVRVKFVLFPGDGDGRLGLTLSKGDRDEFRVTLHSDGTVTLDRSVRAGARGRVDAPKRIAEGWVDALRSGQAVTIEFENVDYRVSLRVNDVEVVATTSETYGPDIDRLRGLHENGAGRKPTRLRISAAGAPLEIRHLQVHRDVFYRSGVFLDNQSSAANPSNPYARQPGWGTANHPILLRSKPGDFFCCGDNSPQSKDSRLWWEVGSLLQQRGDYNPGTVPADQMIGRAFFVYWPSGYQLFSTPYGVIPNVGRMRIIR